MAVDWMDGVAHYGFVPGAPLFGYYQVLAKYTAGVATIMVGAGPRGNNALQPAGASGGLMITRTHQKQAIFGFRYNPGFLSPGVGLAFFQARHVGTPILTVQLEQDQTISLYSGNSNTVLIANTGSAFKMSGNTWYYFEVEITANGGNPFNVGGVLKINGVQLLSGSANAQFNQTDLLPVPTPSTCNTTNNYIIDSGLFCDLLLTRVDGSGRVNSFVGDVRIDAVFPNQDVTTQWSSTGSPHYQQVNATQPPYPESTYINSGTPGQLDEFIYQPISPTLGQIVAVHFLAYARKDNEGTRQFGLTVSGNQVSATFSPSDEATYFSIAMDADPDTVSQWTIPGFNAKHFGAILVS